MNYCNPLLKERERFLREQEMDHNKPTDRNQWCAMCGRWGNHSSGSCPEFGPERFAKYPEDPHAA